MKRYKLLKDLPTFKAGQLAYISGQGSLIAGTPDNPEITYTGVQLMMYHKTTLDKFPEILTEWFEKIPEPTSSIHWKPENGDEYFYISDYGDIYSGIWRGLPIDNERLALGFIYPTEEECKKAKERKLAEARLCQTSTFEPDFENGKGGWIVSYDHQKNRFLSMFVGAADYGEPVHYKTKEDTEKSIEENEQDWKIYFGIEEKKGENNVSK